MKRLRWILVAFLIIAPGIYSFSSLSQEPYIDIEHDTVIVLQLRSRLHTLLNYIEPTLSTSSSKPFTRSEKRELWEFWQSWLELYQALDIYGKTYDDYFKSIKKKPNKLESFTLSYFIFLTEYRYALELITLLERHPNLDDILNDAVPELGVPEKTYSDFKFRYLNVVRATELGQSALFFNSLVDDEVTLTELKPFIDEDETVVLDYGMTDGAVYTLNSAIDFVEESALTAWYPIKRDLISISSRVKIWRPSTYLITEGQLADLQDQLLPGDLVFQKREWQISNTGIPGFWAHVALYIGSSEEQNAFFSEDDALSIQTTLQKGEGQFNVIESVETGVILSSFIESSKSDSVLVLRPNIRPELKAEAIRQALHFLGRPYDYDFNVNTDSAIFCSELISKVYEPLLFSDSTTFPRSDVFGISLTSPNDIVQFFDQDTTGVLSFVAFLDGNEFEQSAVLTTENAARLSWKRPRWYVLETTAE